MDNRIYEEASIRRLMEKYDIDEETASSVIREPELLLKTLMSKDVFSEHLNNKKKILFIHGLGGDKESHTGIWIQEEMPEYDVIRPTLPETEPYLEYIFISNLIEQFHPVLVVGSSLGGFFTLLQKNVKKAVINPVMEGDQDILHSDALMNRPKDNVFRVEGTPFYQCEHYLQQLKELNELYHTEIVNDDSARDVCGIFGNDPTGFFLHYEDFRRLYPGKEAKLISAGHKLEEDQVKTIVVPQIRELLK